MTIKTLVIASSWRAYKNCLCERGLNFNETKYVTCLSSLCGYRNVEVIKYANWWDSAIYVKNTEEEVDQMIKGVSIK